MPMAGHIAKIGQIIAADFRRGNASPTRENLEFIKQWQQSLPKGCAVNAQRIDSAGYQTKIIRHCDEDNIFYAIRTNASATLKETTKELSITK